VKQSHACLLEGKKIISLVLSFYSSKKSGDCARLDGVVPTLRRGWRCFLSAHGLTLLIASQRQALLFPGYCFCFFLVTGYYKLSLTWLL